MVDNVGVIEHRNGNKHTSLSNMLHHILSLPNWVKQYFYLSLRDDIKNVFDIEKLDNTATQNLIHLYVPNLSTVGQKIVQRRFNQNAISFDVDDDEKMFLQTIGSNKTVIDICGDNKWSLLKCLNIMVSCIDKGYVDSIYNPYLYNSIYYITGRIKLGEYLLRMNKLSLEQVNQALEAQNDVLTKFGHKTKIGELFVNLGFIDNSDKNEVLQLKENSDVVCNVIDEIEKVKTENAEIKTTLKVVMLENESIKEELLHYQDELLNKAQLIQKLEAENQKLSKKQSLFFRLF